MIQLNRIGKEEGLSCDLFVKCEFFSAGGSVKDRIALRMIEEAEREGRITPGVTTIIEPTSGNTGIGLAMAAAIKGYRVIITLPEKMSDEKVNVLKALGAEIVRTPTEAAWDAPESHIGVARKLEKELPNAVILDQYKNPYNPLAHYDETAVEILDQMDYRVDMVVLGAGTGGTISGIAKKIKQHLPHCKIIGVDPHGSLLAQPSSLNVMSVGSYFVEGIGYDFIPDVLDRSLVDYWVKTSDKESFVMARRLIREEGLLCGGSSGAAIVAALEVAKTLTAGQRCVVILPDSVRNYMSKFLVDDWMKTRGFMCDKTKEEEEKGPAAELFGDATVADLNLSPAIMLPMMSTCKEAVVLMQEKKVEAIIIVNDQQQMVGVVTRTHLLTKKCRGYLQGHDPVTLAMFPFEQRDKYFHMVTPQKRLVSIIHFLDRYNLVLVTSDSQALTSGNKPRIEHIITKSDLFDYGARHI
jgi:cystathionine beta-synthase